MSHRTKHVVVVLLVVLLLGGLVQLGRVLAQGGLLGAAPKQSYEEWLNEFDVHDKFRAELERLRGEQHSRRDLMVAYTFLYYQYGKIDELEPLVKRKEGGDSWAKVFADSLKDHDGFVPRTYDTKYLESLTSAANISADDIMIADRLSFVTGEPMDSMLSAKLESGKKWKDIAAELGIVNGSSALPRVEITAAQLEKFSTTTFPQEKVAEAFVLSQKVGLKPQEVVSQMKAGRTQTDIMAKAWAGRYSSY
ncbi:hypothetical protein [Paenibacillus sanfengchensis]|uniref:hypothetical protein n=1 Tax=Paenibacillus sanfengchensis TaxID=3119819 RepID=UPI002FE0AEA3